MTQTRNIWATPKICRSHYFELLNINLTCRTVPFFLTLLVGSYVSALGISASGLPELT